MDAAAKRMHWSCPLLLAAALWGSARAASIEGRWTTFDDETRKPRAVVEIVRDGRRFDGRVVALLPDASDDPDPLCSACVGSDAGKHIIGLTILRLADEHGNFVGTVLDPEDGTLYRCVVTAVPAHDSLELRAYVGVPLFGRTVMWKRAP